MDCGAMCLAFANILSTYSECRAANVGLRNINNPFFVSLNFFLVKRLKFRYFCLFVFVINFEKPGLSIFSRWGNVPPDPP